MSNTNTPFTTVYVFGCKFNTCLILQGRYSRHIYFPILMYSERKTEQSLFVQWVFCHALSSLHFFNCFILVICCPTFPTLLEFQTVAMNSSFVLLFPVLHRCHGNTQLRLQQNHNVQDEVLNPSSLLSTSRHTSDFRFVLRLLPLPTSVLKLCFQPKSSKDRRTKK